MTSVDGYPRIVFIVSLMGLRRFFAAGAACLVESVLLIKVVQMVVCDFYTELYTICQRSLGKRMDTSFGVVYNFGKCTFNPFVVGSTPAGPTIFLNEIKHLERSKCFFSVQKYIT